MRVSVVGAGSVGLHLAARLARAGADVGIVARDPSSAELLAHDGVSVVESATAPNAEPPADHPWRCRLPRVHRVDDDAAFRAVDVALLCCREPELEELAARVSRSAGDAAVVCAQNGAWPERHALPHFRAVFGLVVRYTCMRVAANSVRTRGVPRLLLGAAAPESLGPEDRRRLDALAAALGNAGFDVGRSSALREDRWLKLCANLLSPVNALVPRDQHSAPEFAGTKIALLAEARACLAAAGIAAGSSDGRDPSLEEMIATLREEERLGVAASAEVAAGLDPDARPVNNAVWTALRKGAPLEADSHLGEFIALGERFGVETPMLRLVLAALLRCRRESLGPESVLLSELRP